MQEAAQHLSMFRKKSIVPTIRWILPLAILFLLFTQSTYGNDEIKYTLDPASSDIRILVFRDGPLKTFGHNHVIRAKHFQGIIMRDRYYPFRSNFSITIPVNMLEVDKPEDRKISGQEFALEIEPSSASATRRNMIGKHVLQENLYPSITIHGNTIAQANGVLANAEICIRKNCKNYHISFRVHVTDEHIRAKGELRLLQTDHAIAPYSLLGGALRVKNEIRILVNLVARSHAH